jgi:peptidoglycan/xylan/chitin deacetylase (PgdA/CDA1 family)
VTSPHLPPSGTRSRTRRPRRGPAHRPARIGLSLLATAILALPFYAAAEYYLYQKYMSPQANPPVVRVDAAHAAAWTRTVKGLPATSAPVVLTYHDINPISSSPYAVTPTSFDAQLSALESAGYRSLTTEEFVDYLKGGPAPPRSVYITFDDGTNGLWVYADRILARHHMHAASFLITGMVNNDRPYYLTWNEISRMVGSGRWDFQDHTHDLHHRGPIDAAGHTASALANRLWLKKQNRLETPQEYDARVNADIQQSIKDITSHGLPKPQVFAFPFSESTGHDNVPGGVVNLQNLLTKYFVTTMTDVSTRPLTASRRAASAHRVQRLEVLSSTKPEQLLSQIAQWTQVAPAATSPLAQPALWTRNDGTDQSGIGIFTGQGPYAGKVHYAAADYRQMSSVDWTDYQVNATITGLGNGTNQASIAVRNNSLDPVTASVSQGNLVLSQSGRQMAIRKLTPSTSHTLQVTVSGANTTARVDGTTVLSWTSKETAGNLTGGIGIRVGINRPSASWPAFSALSVSQLAQGSGTATGSQQAISGSTLLTPNSLWDSAPGAPAPFQISTNLLEPYGRALSAYGAYEPQKTGGWTDYTVSGTISRLSSPGVSGALWVRVGSALAISVQVSNARLDVYAGNADNQRLVATRPLSPAAQHHVIISVTANSTAVNVDGVIHTTLLAKGETGGVAYSAYRDLTRRSWPTLLQATVSSTVSAGTTG